MGRVRQRSSRHRIAGEGCALISSRPITTSLGMDVRMSAPIEVPILILKKDQVLLTIRSRDFSFVLEKNINVKGDTAGLVFNMYLDITSIDTGLKDESFRK